MPVTDNPVKNRYELDVSGALAIAEYRLDGNKIIITHVEVPESLRGQGVAAKVMEGVVADASRRGLAIVPVCPYAASYMKRQASRN